MLNNGSKWFSWPKTFKTPKKYLDHRNRTNYSENIRVRPNDILRTSVVRTRKWQNQLYNIFCLCFVNFVL